MKRVINRFVSFNRSTVEQKNSASLVNPDNGKSVDSSQQNNQGKDRLMDLGIRDQFIL